MNKLAVMVNCFYTVSVDANAHRVDGETVIKHLEAIEAALGEDASGDDPENDIFDAHIRDLMIEKNSVVRVTVYPRNSVGFYTVWHYDVDKAIDEMYEQLKGRYRLP